MSATDAAKGFGGLVDKVREHGVTFIVERGGVPVAQVGPITETRCTVSDLVGYLRRARGRRDERFAREVRAGVRRLNAPAVPRDPWTS